MDLLEPVGVTILPEYFQGESVNGLLDNLQRRPAVTAVTTSPYVMELADSQSSFRDLPSMPEPERSACWTGGSGESGNSGLGRPRASAPISASISAWTISLRLRTA